MHHHISATLAAAVLAVALTLVLAGTAAGTGRAGGTLTIATSASPSTRTRCTG